MCNARNTARLVSRRKATPRQTGNKTSASTRLVATVQCLIELPARQKTRCRVQDTGLSYGIQLLLLELLLRKAKVVIYHGLVHNAETGGGGG